MRYNFAERERFCIRIVNGERELCAVCDLREGDLARMYESDGCPCGGWFTVIKAPWVRLDDGVYVFESTP